ncbi:hypothetical protein [Allochromatium palmeri]|uniref:Uncharacterized protein n=1 Tax=Allochromatium palmeri TaxID=231048 RepID=A0A6N8E6T1_9GAMM|nr:hypothetical protein [Allochromatium palmeri]MTW19932.1 hypothetical protein [Allochromatium palmeri]
MYIEAKLDEIHGQRLMDIQRRLQKPLPEVLAALIDLGQELFPEPDEDAEEPSPLYAALEDIGFVGCIEAEVSLAKNYKTQLDFSGKHGEQP